jgi:hypothetical protein
MYTLDDYTTSCSYTAPQCLNLAVRRGILPEAVNVRSHMLCLLVQNSADSGFRRGDIPAFLPYRPRSELWVLETVLRVFEMGPSIRYLGGRGERTRAVIEI